MYEIFASLMEERGITAYRVAKDTGVSQSTLSAWKLGQAVPKIDKMVAIANYFGVTVEYLTTGKTDPKNATSDRYVELPEEVIEMLGNGPKSENIVKMVPHSITTGFLRLTASCGVSVRFHDLRHYSASVMHAIGVPDQYIMARHGWKTDATLKAVYREALEDKKNSFTDKTNQYMKGLLVNET